MDEDLLRRQFIVSYYALKISVSSVLAISLNFLVAENFLSIPQKILGSYKSETTALITNGMELQH